MNEDDCRKLFGDKIKKINLYEDKIKCVVDNVVVVLPSDYDVKDNFFCTICLYPMRDYQDEKTFEDNKCCDFCDTNIVRPNMKKWKEGWRPSHEEVQEIVNSKFYNKIGL